ncbi:hypothetical protein B0H19DRAFT_1373236, partial [Mycena capillaripes]
MCCYSAVKHAPIRVRCICQDFCVRGAVKATCMIVLRPGWIEFLPLLVCFTGSTRLNQASAHTPRTVQRPRERELGVLLTGRGTYLLLSLSLFFSRCCRRRTSPSGSILCDAHSGAWVCPLHPPRRSTQQRIALVLRLWRIRVLRGLDSARCARSASRALSRVAHSSWPHQSAHALPRACDAELRTNCAQVSAKIEDCRRSRSSSRCAAPRVARECSPAKLRLGFVNCARASPCGCYCEGRRHAFTCRSRARSACDAESRT